MNTPPDQIDPNTIHVLFVVQKPEKDEERWNNFVYYASNKAGAGPLQTDEPHEWKSKRLAENVWLIQLKLSLPFLGRLAAAAERTVLPYKYLVFP